MDAVLGEINKLQGVATRVYGAGERLAPEHLKQLDVYVRDGAIALRVAAGGASPAIVEIFGPEKLITARLWDGAPGSEIRHAAALIRTTTLEVSAVALERQLRANPDLAATMARRTADQQLASLDRLAMLALRDPLPRVAHALLLLLERLPRHAVATGNARLAVGQELIAGFAGLSRQTTNRQLRRLARAGVLTLRRQAVELRDRAALANVAGRA